MNFSHDICQVFSTQYRRVLANGDDEVFLLGGKNAITGPRSKYSANACCFSLEDNSLKWEYVHEKSYPFSNAVLDGNLVVGMIHENFPREPCGIWIFERSSGENIESVSLPSGLSICSGFGSVILAIPDFENKTSRLEAVSPTREQLGNVESSEFDSLVGMCMASERLALLSFKVVQKSKIQYRHELLETQGLQTRWSMISDNDCLLVSDEFAYTYSSEDMCKSIESVDLRNGNVTDVLSIKEPGIQRLVVQNGRHFLWANDNRELVYFDRSSKAMSRLDLSTDIPGWLDFAVLTDGRIIALSTENHLTMKSHLSICRLLM